MISTLMNTISITMKIKQGGMLDEKDTDAQMCRYDGKPSKKEN